MDIDPKEFLVSEAMKVACYNDIPVIIIGVKKEETFEKDISCNKFHALVSFIPPHTVLTESLAIIGAYPPQIGLVCGQPKPCTAVSGKKSDTYAGHLIYDICHELSHIGGLHYTQAELDKFLSIFPAISWIDLNSSLNNITLFIPLQNEEVVLVSSFIQEMKKLASIANTGNTADFGNKYDEFYNNEIFNRFPFIGGDF